MASSSGMGRLVSSSVMGTIKGHNAATIVLDRYFLTFKEGIQGRDLSGCNMQKFVVVRGVVEGNQNKKKEREFLIDSWDIARWSGGKAPTLMLRSGRTWIELRNPLPNQLETNEPRILESETMETNMVAAYFMAIAKHTPHASEADVWRYICDECSGFTVNPTRRDLKRSFNLVKAIVEIDSELQQSPILAEYFPDLSRPNRERRDLPTRDRIQIENPQVVESRTATEAPTPGDFAPDLPAPGVPAPEVPAPEVLAPEVPATNLPAPVTTEQTLQEGPDVNEDEEFKGPVNSAVHPGLNGHSVLDAVREGTRAIPAQGSAVHPCCDSVTQALDTPVDVSGTQHLTLTGEGNVGERNAEEKVTGERNGGEGNATGYTDEILANWVDEPDVCTFCDDGVNGNDDLLCCDYCMRSFHPTPASGSHRNCISLNLSRAVSEIKDWLCPNCEAKQHQCFACGKLGISDPKSSLRTVFECDATKCKRFYHRHCVVKLPNSREAQDADSREAQDAEAAGFTFTCPLHKCEKCNESRITGLVKCRRCPRAWHKKCFPEELQSRMWNFAEKYVVYCEKHKMEEDMVTAVQDHIVFPKAGKKRGRETQESSDLEPASDNPNARRESRLEADQPLVEGIMADTSEAASVQKVKGKELVDPQNMEDMADPIPLQPVKKKPQVLESHANKRV